ncbi:class I SAM-dependent methyltransferase [Eisenibacter elegans]|uniref:class I SAM-dependent methyltransferase n=1 Tax=Eisenibacter elegans TaxID=997 RepID=UPI0004066361|nr:class I SAM-dependent methyltransferase [Eisenibacter elegans]
MISRIAAAFRLFRQQTDKKLNNTQAGVVLNGLLAQGVYLPLTSSALDLVNMAIVLNDIVINERKTIVEFGSGASTVLIARLLKRNGIDARIYTIDHDEKWLAVVQRLLQQENLSSYVTLIPAPLTANNISLEHHQWYDTTVCDVALSGLSVDMVIVDGPPAWDKSIALARYPAVPYLKSRLSENCVIYLDDAGRIGEQQILQSWAQLLGAPFRIVGNDFGAIPQGSFFNPYV